MSLGMTGTVVEELSSTAEDHVALCVGVLGRELTAYVAGAESVPVFERWHSGPIRADDLMARRLATTAEIIGTFAAANKISLVAPWLREVPRRNGKAPATLIREMGEDDIVARQVCHFAGSAVKEW